MLGGFRISRHAISTTLFPSKPEEADNKPTALATAALSSSLHDLIKQIDLLGLAA